MPSVRAMVYASGRGIAWATRCRARLNETTVALNATLLIGSGRLLGNAAARCAPLEPGLDFGDLGLPGGDALAGGRACKAAELEGKPQDDQRHDQANGEIEHLFVRRLE